MSNVDYKKSKRSIFLYYIYALLTSCVFSRGIFMLFLAYKGLDVAQIGIYQMLVQISMSVFEIPTGYIGDRIGKIKSLQIGVIILAVYCWMMIVLNHPIALISLGVVEGVGYTFLSGSDSALLYELLKNTRREQDYLKLNARLQSLQSILIGVTIAIGAVIISWSWNAVYGITAICLIGALIALIPISEPTIQCENKDNDSIDRKSKIKSIVSYSNIFVFLICVIGFSCFDGISGSYYNYNQILFQQNNIPVLLIGVFFSASYFLASAAYLFASWLAKIVSKKQVVFLMIMLQGILFLVLAFTRQMIFFVIISAICCFIPEIVYILADSIIQAYIQSKYRATILSVISMFRSLTSAISYSILGAVINRTNTTGFMIFMALSTFGVFCGFKLILVYDKNIKEKNER